MSFSKLSFKKLMLVLLIPITVIVGIAVFAFAGGGATSDVPAAGQTESHLVDRAQYNNAELNEAARKAEEASNRVLDQAKGLEEIGAEDEGRNQHLEDAREHAGQKWQSFADKIRAAKDSQEPLTPVERVNVKHLLETDE